MTDGNGSEANPTPEAAPQTPAVKMQILAQFIRDLSFENVLAQKPIKGDVVPEVTVQVGIDARKREVENQYEVVLKFNVKSKNKGKEDVMFLLELEYAGVFSIEGVPEDQMHPFLMIECPRQLFPFVRRIVSDNTRDGGFPPVNIDTVDFVALYRQEIQRRAAENKEQPVAQ